MTEPDEDSSSESHVTPIAPSQPLSSPTSPTYDEDSLRSLVQHLTVAKDEADQRVLELESKNKELTHQLTVQQEQWFKSHTEMRQHVDRLQRQTEQAQADLAAKNGGFFRSKAKKKPVTPENGLESSQKAAQEHTNLLRSIVQPMEQQIEFLQRQLKAQVEAGRIPNFDDDSFHEGSDSNSHSSVLQPRAQNTDSMSETASLSVDLLNSSLSLDSVSLRSRRDSGSNSAIDRSQNKTAEYKALLKAEKSKRQDLEMQLEVVQTQKKVLQTETEEANLALNRERTVNADLRLTWQRANEHFLDLQRSLEEQCRSLEDELQIYKSGTSGTTPTSGFTDEQVKKLQQALENERTLSKEKIEQLDSRYQELSNRFEIELSSERSQWQTQRGDFEGEIQAQRMQLVEFQSRVDAVEEEKQALQTKINDLQLKLAEPCPRCQNYENSLVRAQQEKTEAFKKRDETIEKMKVARERIESVLAAQSICHQKYLAKALDRLESELRAEYSNKVQEIDTTYRAQLDEAETMLQKFKPRQEQMDAVFQDFKTKFEEAKAAKEQEVLRLKQSLRDTEERLNNKNLECLELRQKYQPSFISSPPLRARSATTSVSTPNLAQDTLFDDDDDENLFSGSTPLSVLSRKRSVSLEKPKRNNSLNNSSIRHPLLNDPVSPGLPIPKSSVFAFSSPNLSSQQAAQNSLQTQQSSDIDKPNTVSNDVMFSPRHTTLPSIDNSLTTTTDNDQPLGSKPNEEPSVSQKLHLAESRLDSCLAEIRSKSELVKSQQDKLHALQTRLDELIVANAKAQEQLTAHAADKELCEAQQKQLAELKATTREKEEQVKQLQDLLNLSETNLVSCQKSLSSCRNEVNEKAKALQMAEQKLAEQEIAFKHIRTKSKEVIVALQKALHAEQAAKAQLQARLDTVLITPSLPISSSPSTTLSSSPSSLAPVAEQSEDEQPTLSSSAPHVEVADTTPQQADDSENSALVETDDELQLELEMDESLKAVRSNEDEDNDDEFVRRLLDPAPLKTNNSHTLGGED
eukprot:m.94027 g.94027  ORF g.94027 m.94027 type:complete len:1028 (-) comp21833_c0_seq1:83-3166(-)